MVTPDEKPSQMQSAYNDGERKTINDRFKTIERMVGADTNYGERLNVSAGLFRMDSLNQETLSAAGAASLTKILTLIDGTTSAFAGTLAAPTVDGQLKAFKMVTSASSHPTLSGTNIVSASGSSQTGKTAPFTSITAGSVSFIILFSLGGVWVTLASNITFA